MSLKRQLPFIAIVASLMGCSSPMDASKDNFTKAINADLEKQCIRVVFDMNSAVQSGSFPVSVRISQKNSWRSEADAEASTRDNLRQFEALVGAGLLKRDEGTAKASYGKGDVPAKVYSLTDAGMKSLFKKDRTTFCAGTYQVAAVVSFTTPGQSLDGATVSSAKFTLKPVGVPAWARAEAVLAAFPQLAEALSGKQEGKAKLVLQNDGWFARTSSF